MKLTQKFKLAINLALVTGVLLVSAVSTSNAFAAEDKIGNEVMLAKFRKLYPATKFDSVKATPVPSMYELHMGKNVVYAHEDGRYFFFGSLYDMKNQEDLTASGASADTGTKIDFSKLPLNKAIKTVKGNGKRVVAVFSDPECPYCKRLEVELSKVTDVTIYTFMYPLDGLHPEAKSKAEAVWCSKDRSAAWQALLLKGKIPEGVKNCATPIDEIVALAGDLGIQGTPFIITKDGRTMPGAAEAARLSSFINEPTLNKVASDKEVRHE